MGHCCHGNNLPNPVSETYLNGNLSAPTLSYATLPFPSLHKSRFISDAPVGLRSPPSPLSQCIWPWLVALQRQHSPEVFKQIIEPVVKQVEEGGEWACVSVETNKNRGGEKDIWGKRLRMGGGRAMI